MSNTETNGNELGAARIIDEFRATTPAPDPDDWNALIVAHPEFAAEIADAAFLAQASEALEESDVEAPLDHEVFDSGVSQAINLLYELPSAALSQTQEKIARAKGTAVRTLAREMGLGSAAALLSGVLVGSIEAPAKLLRLLAGKWSSTELVLAECFRRSSSGAAVPAYKAEKGKPGLAMQPTPWAEAVRSLNLSEHETQRLLEFQD
jgi:hypothetical protein